MNESNNQHNNQEGSESLPFAAPCKKLELSAPMKWLRLGWQDIKRAPIPSLSYGVLLVVLSYVLTYLALAFGNLVVLLSMLSGFIFIGPVIAIGFYDISQQLQQDQEPTLGHALHTSMRHIGNEMLFATFLIVIFLVWARAVSITHIFFPALSNPSLADQATFLLIGFAIGTLFAIFIFCISAFSLSMIMDRKADMVTAIVTSFNAVLRNKAVMLLWALLIAVAVIVGMVTAFIGLAITMPLIGHATWHAYRETIDASAWPHHAEEEAGS
jgi:uncharacterized membrane protein